MNDKEESKKMFALVLYNLLTSTIYSYDRAFLDEVAAFVNKANFPKQYKELLDKMMKCAYSKMESCGGESK